MDEQIPMPFDDWDYETIDLDDEPYLEIRGHTPEREIILFSARPSGGRDFAEWLREFEAGTLGEFSVNIDAYFGPKIAPPKPDDDPKDAEAYIRSQGFAEDPEPVEHIIYIGEGLAKWDGTAMTLSMAPNIFPIAASSFLAHLDSEGTKVEERILQIFTLVDPDGFSRFLSTLGTLKVPPSIDTTYLIHQKRKPTYSHVLLTSDQLVKVLGMNDGVISFQQLYTSLPVQDRTLRQWLREAEMVEVGHKRLTGWLFTKDEILGTFVTWLRKNIRTDAARTLIRNLIIAKLIDR